MKWLLMIKPKSKDSSTTKAELATASWFHWQAFCQKIPIIG